MLTATATIEKYDDMYVAPAINVFTTADIENRKGLAATAPIALTATATIENDGTMFIDDGGNFAITATASLTNDGYMATGPSISVDATANLGGIYDLEATASISLTASAGINRIGDLEGAADITLEAGDSAVERIANLAASVDIMVNTTVGLTFLRSDRALEEHWIIVEPTDRRIVVPARNNTITVDPD